MAYTSGSIGMGGYSTAVSGTSCTSGQTLGIGASCVIAVAFTPQCSAHGSRNANLNIQGTGATTVQVQLIVYSNKTTLCQ